MVARLRKKQNLTLFQLVRLVGVTEANMSMHEKGARSPKRIVPTRPEFEIPPRASAL